MKRMLAAAVVRSSAQIRRRAGEVIFRRGSGAGLILPSHQHPSLMCKALQVRSASDHSINNRFKQSSAGKLSPMLSTDHRTHTCGELRLSHCGETVRLSGWIQNTRKLGGILFLAIRDQYGITQLRVGGGSDDNIGRTHNGDTNNIADQNYGDNDNAKYGADFFFAGGLRPETIVSVKGIVTARPDDAVNDKMRGGTGEIEVEIADPSDMIVLNEVDFSNMALQPQQLLFRTNDTNKNLSTRKKKGKNKKRNNSNSKADSDSVAGEELRLQYRHLDLRRVEMQRNLRLRSNVTLAARTHLASLGFTEVETPVLFKSTPEGAREFLVPTRRHSEFYALPQSPQQHKQLLMCGGVDRYFQVARCFRDEGGRADRQPEFTQLDLEMSFVGAEDVMATVESTVAAMIESAHETMKSMDFGSPILIPDGDLIRSGLPRMRFVDAMTRFGSDKPDTRFGLEICNVTSLLSNSENTEDRKFSLPAGFQRSIAGGREVRAIRVPNLGSKLSRKEVTSLAENIMNYLGSEIASEQVIVAALKDSGQDELKWVSSSASMRFLGSNHIESLSNGLEVREGDLVALVGDPVPLPGAEYSPTSSKPPASSWRGCEALGKFRSECAELLVQLGPDQNKQANSEDFDYDFREKWAMMWVTDFPLFEEESDASYVQAALNQQKSSTEGSNFKERPLASSHHPFTAPHPDDEAIVLNYDASTEIGIESLLKVRGQHYDLVCNGVELGGGSIRIHNKNMQTRIFSEVLGLSRPMQESFKHLTEALGHGCPPHGGKFIFMKMLIVVFVYRSQIVV